MTIIKKTYGTKSEFKADSILMNRRGFSALHHDAPFIITWVTSDEKPQPPPKTNQTRTEFVNQLAAERRINLT